MDLVDFLSKIDDFACKIPKNFAPGAASSKRSNLKSLLKEKDFKLVKIHFQNLVPKPPNQYVPPLFKRQINKGGTY